MLLRIRAANGCRPTGRALRLAAVSVLALSACSTDSALSVRPGVDIGTTASYAPESTADGKRYVLPDQSGLSQQTQYGTQDTGYSQPDTEYASVGDGSYGAPPSSLQEQAERLGPPSDEPYPLAAETDSMAGAGAIEPIDAQVGQQDMAGAATSDAEMADGVATWDSAMSQPAGASQYRVDNVDALGLPGQPEQPAATDSYRVAALPRVNQPRIESEPSISSDEIACRAALKKLDVSFKDLPPIREGRSCGIDHPVRISSVGRVKVSPAATLTCDMARTFATWTKKELVPAARSRYLTGVRTIHQASSYSCRNIAGSGTLSEHGKGNAIDISRIELNSGRDIDVRKKGLFAFRAKGLLNSVRSDGCEYFSTVLGPGYNRDHRDHFHFDIKERRNGRRACH